MLSRSALHFTQFSKAFCWVGRGLCDPSCPRAESKLLCISVFSFHILQSVFLFRGKKTFIHFCISETSNIADSSESLIYQEGTKSGFSAYFIEAAKQLDGERKLFTSVFNESKSGFTTPPGGEYGPVAVGKSTTYGTASPRKVVVWESRM